RFEVRNLEERRDIPKLDAHYERKFRSAPISACDEWDSGARCGRRIRAFARLATPPRARITGPARPWASEQGSRWMREKCCGAIVPVGNGPIRRGPCCPVGATRS